MIPKRVFEFIISRTAGDIEKDLLNDCVGTSIQDEWRLESIGLSMSWEAHKAEHPDQNLKSIYEIEVKNVKNGHKSNLGPFSIEDLTFLF